MDSVNLVMALFSLAYVGFFVYLIINPKLVFPVYYALQKFVTKNFHIEPKAGSDNRIIMTIRIIAILVVLVALPGLLRALSGKY